MSRTSEGRGKHGPAQQGADGSPVPPPTGHRNGGADTPAWRSGDRLPRRPAFPGHNQCRGDACVAPCHGPFGRPRPAVPSLPPSPAHRWCPLAEGPGTRAEARGEGGGRAVPADRAPSRGRLHVPPRCAGGVRPAPGRERERPPDRGRGRIRPAARPRGRIGPRPWRASSQRRRRRPRRAGDPRPAHTRQPLPKNLVEFRVCMVRRS